MFNFFQNLPQIVLPLYHKSQKDLVRHVPASVTSQTRPFFTRSDDYTWLMTSLGSFRLLCDDMRMDSLLVVSVIDVVVVAVDVSSVRVSSVVLTTKWCWMTSPLQKCWALALPCSTYPSCRTPAPVNQGELGSESNSHLSTMERLWFNLPRCKQNL